MEVVFGIIYLLIDGTNDMEYVGQTRHSLEKRFKEHKRHKKYYIGNAINQHGEDMFVKVILKVCYSPEELSYWERHFIKSRDTMSTNGYNLTEGGERDFRMSPETIAKISAANSGEKHHMFGKHHTDEAKARMSAKITGRHQSEETKALLSSLQTTKHAVICIETKEIFDSVAAAARHYKVHRSGIILVCKNHQRAVKGFHLWYLEDFNNTTEIVIPPPKTKPQKRAVICVETGEVFETIRQAAQWLGMVHGAVSRACRKHYAAGGYHFYYLEEAPDEVRKFEAIPKSAPAKKLSLKTSKAHPVKCVETNQEFESTSAAARYYNISHSNIRRACKSPEFTSCGYHWCYVDTPQA